MGVSGDSQPVLPFFICLLRIDDYSRIDTAGVPVIFDREIPDNLAYASLFGFDHARARKAARTYRYNRLVFFVPAWEQIYTPDEVEKLLKAASPEFLPVLALGAFAGLRTAEIQRLDWSDINGEYVHVAKHKAKTRTQRFVPLQRNLAAWLAPHVIITRYLNAALDKRAGRAFNGLNILYQRDKSFATK